MAKMGKRKACRPAELPIEAVQIILEYKPEYIVEAFNNILTTNNMPNDWRKSRMVPIFKGKGDVLECNNYVLTYFTLVELFCYRHLVDRQSDVST